MLPVKLKIFFIFKNLKSNREENQNKLPLKGNILIRSPSTMRKNISTNIFWNSTILNSGNLKKKETKF